jgi:hypothetical protein
MVPPRIGYFSTNQTQEATMTRYFKNEDGQEIFEYHGNTAIERIRRQRGRVRRDWLFFDSAEEAEAFFNEQCACGETA